MQRLSSAMLALALLFALALGVRAQQCYSGPNTEASSDYVSCSSDTSLVSACCLEGDCLPNSSICWNKDTGITYIAGCTDSAYSDANNCPGLQCAKDTGFIALAKCDQGWKCCDGPGQRGDKPSSGTRVKCDACADGEASVPSGAIISVSDGKLGPTPGPSGTSATSTAATSTSTDSTATESTSAGSTSDASAAAASTSSASGGPTAVADSSGGDSNGSTSLALKVGLGVGIPMAALVAGLAVWALLFWRRRRREDRALYPAPAHDGSTAVWRGEMHSGPPMAKTSHLSSPYTDASSARFASPPASTMASPRVGGPEGSPALGTLHQR